MRKTVDGYYSLRLPYAMNRKSPMPFRPSELVEALIDEALRNPDKLPESVKASLASMGAGQVVNRNLIINACLSAALAENGALLRMASGGAVTPEVLGEIARRSAFGAEQSASLARETTSASRQSSRIGRAVTRTVRRVGAKKQRVN